MTEDQAIDCAMRLRDACPDLTVVILYRSTGCALRVRERGNDEWGILLPDALSVAAYRDAKRGARAVPGVADFGRSGL